MGGRKRRKATAPLQIITADKLPLFRGYSFAWFSEAATLLLSCRTLDDLQTEDVGKVPSLLLQSLKAKLEGAKAELSKKPLPAVGHDPKNMTLEYAQQVLEKIVSGERVKSLSPPSALSLDFAEYTRVNMGRGRLKREAFRIGEDVLALSIIGAYLTRAYSIREKDRREFGYVFVNIGSPMLPVEVLDRMQAKVRAVTRRLAEGGGGVFPIVVGASAAIALTLREQLREVVKSPLIVEYLRLSQTGTGKKVKKVMAKGFDTFDVTGLAKLMRGCGMAGSAYLLLRSFPSEGFNNYRSFAQKLAEGVAKFHIYRKPVYLYEPLRALTSREVSDEAVELLGPRWIEISERLRAGLRKLAV